MVTCDRQMVFTSLLYPTNDDSQDSLNQVSFETIKDINCTKDTPLIHGYKEDPIYGKGICIKPNFPGRTDTEHFRDIYLPKLLPLEEYDKFIVLLSGGKDSIACYLRLRELGVPKEKIELWHHDIDGGHPSRRMDWRVTSSYVKAFAKAEGVKLRISYRVNGFFGELYRIGASQPIEWVDPDTDEVIQCKLTTKQKECEQIKSMALEESEELLKSYGFRMKFPAKAGDLSRRWCSAYLKISVADAVISALDNLDAFSHEKGQQKKILVVSGERRGESIGRSKYNEMELHRTNAEKRAKRIVHQWRAVIDYTEKDVYELLKRAKVNPHPCYRCGWSRCSCMMCIFSSPKHYKGIQELFPEDYSALRQDEIDLGFTIDNKKNLDDFIDGAKSCVCYDDKKAIEALITGEYSVEDIYVKGEWTYPAGAFHGSEGGSC